MTNQIDLSDSTDCCGGNCSPEGVQAPNATGVVDLTSHPDKASLEHFVEVLQEPTLEPPTEVLETNATLLEELRSENIAKLRDTAKDLPDDKAYTTKKAIVEALKALELALSPFPKSFYLNKATFSINNAVGYLQNDITENGAQ